MKEILQLYNKKTNKWIDSKISFKIIKDCNKDGFVEIETKSPRFNKKNFYRLQCGAITSLVNINNYGSVSFYYRKKVGNFVDLPTPFHFDYQNRENNKKLIKIAESIYNFSDNEIEDKIKEFNFAVMQHEASLLEKK